MNNEYAVFILTYGRADNVITYKTLKKNGYTGEIYLVCSDDDKTLEKYKAKYDKNVIVFSKKDYEGKFDIADNLEDNRVVVYARNAVFDIAEKLGHKYFIVMDDDYNSFRYISDDEGNYKSSAIKTLDTVFDAYIEYYKSIPALCIAPIQGGDLIAGKQNPMFSGGFMKRKVMNVWFCSADRKFKIVGRINEDTNTYTYLGTQGELFLQVPDMRVEQIETQKNKGGLTEFYLDTGTYFKSFYTVMFAPSCTKIAMMGNKNYRLHHNISWNNCCSKIIREHHKRTT